MMRKSGLGLLVVLAWSLLALGNAGRAQVAASNPLAGSLEAVEKATLEKVAADRALAEKAIAIRSATATHEALTDAVKKAQEAKLSAEKVGAADAKGMAEKTLAELEAQAKSVKETVDRVVKEQAELTKAAQEKAAALAEANKKLTAEKAPLVKAATDTANAVNAAITERDKAAAELAKKTAAANTAVQTANASQAALTKLVAEAKPAEKDVADKTQAAKVAADALAASQKAAKDAETAAAAEKDPAKKKALTDSAKTAADKAAAAKAASDKAAADKAAADKVLAEKVKAVKAAEAKAAADKAAADKVVADKTAAENDVKARNAAIQAATYKAAEARAVAEGGLKMLPESAWDYAKARHLLLRAGFGGTPDEVTRLHQMGLIQAVNYLVDYQFSQPGDDIVVRIDVPERPKPNEGLLPQQERNLLNQRRENQRNANYAKLKQWWMRRLVESPRPLQEKLVLFWHGHFATEWEKVPWPHLLYQQNQLFRDHANGNFGGLLYGIVHDPAMLWYLDNNVNFKGRPNQNLARELMELFSMGVNQGYNEYDIREGSRTLTGFNFDLYTGQFRLNQNQHDTEPKTLFGQTGPWTGDDFCALILQQPHTARFISAKLFEYFVYTDPDPKVVAQLATMMRSNSYEMAPLLKNIFMSEEFYSPRAVRTQIKGPIQLLAGLLRDFGAKGMDPNTLLSWSAEMGQDLFQPPNVKGWNGGREWVNANLIFKRYTYVTNLVRNMPQANGQKGVDVVALLQGKNCSTPEQVVDYLARCCLAGPVNEEQRKELAGYIGPLPPPTEWAKQKDQLNAKFQQVLILLLTTPDAQMS